MTTFVRPTMRRRYHSVPETSRSISSFLSRFVVVLLIIIVSTTTTIIYNPFNQQQQKTTTTNYLIGVAAADDNNAAYYEDVGYGDDLTDWDGSDDKFYKSKSSDIKYWTDYAIYPRRCIK
jgi:hypothetical protein